MIKFRAIKPPKLNIPAIMEEVFDEADSLANDVLLEYELTTATWKHQPKFLKVLTFEGGVTIAVFTDDKIYGYVTRGTDGPYPIVPKKPGGVLAFREGYSAKTTPGMLGSQAGGPSGNMAFARGVMHPGIKARNFDKLILDEWKPEITRRLKNAITRGARKSGFWYKG